MCVQSPADSRKSPTKEPGWQSKESNDSALLLDLLGLNICQVSLSHVVHDSFDKIMLAYSSRLRPGFWQLGLEVCEFVVVVVWRTCRDKTTKRKYERRLVYDWESVVLSCVLVTTDKTVSMCNGIGLGCGNLAPNCFIFNWSTEDLIHGSSRRGAPHLDLLRGVFI